MSFLATMFEDRDELPFDISLDLYVDQSSILRSEPLIALRTPSRSLSLMPDVSSLPRKPIPEELASSDSGSEQDGQTEGLEIVETLWWLIVGIMVIFLFCLPFTLILVTHELILREKEPAYLKDVMASKVSEKKLNEMDDEKVRYLEMMFGLRQKDPEFIRAYEAREAEKEEP